MVHLDPRIDAYMESRAPFARPILERVRERLHSAFPDVEETIRWSMPGVSHAGRRLATMAAFKTYASFGL